MFEMSESEFDIMVLSMATEDMHGLYEIVWTLNASHPSIPREINVAAAQASVGRLAHLGLIEVHNLQWQPTADFGRLESDALPQVLADPSSWEPGQRYVGFVATDDGARYYFAEPS